MKDGRTVIKDISKEECMLGDYKIRTDLALEARERFDEKNVELRGVEVKETFEKNWEPLESEPSLTPVKLIIILDLYFQLTPITMVPETPEIIDLGKLIKTSPKVIAEAMGVFMYCDPYLNREDVLIHPLLEACSDIWHQYGNGNPDRLYQLANELKEYFK